MKTCKECGSSMSLWCDAEVKKLKGDRAELAAKAAELRTSINEIFEKNKRLQSAIVQVREQRTNILKQLGRSEENLMELRNKIAAQQKQIGWYNPSSKRFSYMDEMDRCGMVPVYIKGNE